MSFSVAMAIGDKKGMMGVGTGKALDTALAINKAIKSAKVVGFADLGMEAIYEFDVKDMPVTVAVDASGSSVHITGPKEWQERIASTIGKIPVTVA